MAGRRRPRILAAALGAAMTVSALTAASGTAASADSADCPWVGSKAPTGTKVAQILGQMTLDEKLSMLTLNGGAGYENEIPAIPRLCIPMLTLEDGPAGVETALAVPQPASLTNATQLPAPIDAAAAFDPSVAHAYGTIEGTEAWAMGIDDVQGPDVNIARVPESGRTFEGYGEDPYLTSQTAVADIKGIQAAGPMAMVKHFAANNQETGRTTINEIIDDRTLHEIYYPAFKAAIQDGRVASVMCALNQVNNAFACQNPQLLTDAMKTDWGFQGFIRSDSGAVNNTAAAYNAGMDQVKVDLDPTTVAAAVQDGQVPMSRINDAVSRILREMFRFGIIDHPPTGSTNTVVTSPAHAAMARTIAEQGTVLLKNESHVLPLSSNVKSIAVIGPDGGDNAVTTGGGSSQIFSDSVVTPVQGITARAGSGVNVTYTDGSGQLDAAAQAAASADVAIVFANDSETEGADRPNLSLPNNQDALISAVAAANPNTIVVLNTGGPVTMPWLNDVKGVIEGWYAGQEDGNAIAAVLFGDVNPSGKLPITFPKSEADTPAHTPAQWPGVAGVADYSEGLQVGYRWYESQGIAPLFPFGYGLSYTSFSLRDLTMGAQQLSADGRENVSVQVTNTGNRAGAQAVQLYVGMPSSAGEPPEQLKGYQKVYLKPHQSKTVKFTLSPSDLTIWDTAAQAAVTPAGTYQVMVGTSSADIAARGTFQVPRAVGPHTVTTAAPATVGADSTVTITTAFHNLGQQPVRDARLGLSAPAGWTATATSATSFKSVAAGQTVQVSWQVTVPGDATPGQFGFTGTAAFRATTGSQHISSNPARVTLPAPPLPSLSAGFNNIGITDDATPGGGNFDGSFGDAYSAEALAAVGITPGATLTERGVALTWPDVPAGTPDNVTPSGQTVTLSGSGSTLAFLGAAISATQTGTGTVIYTDGSRASFTISFPNWITATPVNGDDLVATTAYFNRTNPGPARTPSLFAAYAPLDPTKQVAQIVLPSNGSLHLFAVGIGG